MVAQARLELLLKRPDDSLADSRRYSAVRQNGFRSAFLCAVLSALGSLVLYRFVISMYSASGTDQTRVKDIALASSVLLQIVPLFAPFGVVFTIDSPFVFF